MQQEKKYETSPISVRAHLHVAGLAPADRRWAALPAAVRCLAGMRQIGDDASDWLIDLQAGQLNWAAAGLISDFRTTASAAEGNIERLAGYELRAEPYWHHVEQAYEELYRQAIDHLAPYTPCRLADLLHAQQARDSAGFAQQCTRRADLRALFNLPQIGAKP